MGERLMKYYQYVGEQKGFDGKVQLAHKTRIPSTKAALEPDAPTTIAAFKDAVAAITGKPAPTL